jgi:hypothetical protein
MLNSPGRRALIDRSVECSLLVIMLQPETLLRRRNLCAADPHPSSLRRWSKETRRSGFFELKSLIDRRGKEKEHAQQRQRIPDGWMTYTYLTRLERDGSDLQAVSWLSRASFRYAAYWSTAGTANLSAWRSQRVSFPDDDRGLRCISFPTFKLRGLACACSIP